MDKYKYVYEDTNDYCYPNTDILINKLNINDDNDLYLAEQELVGLRIKEIVLTPVKGNFDFRHLKIYTNFYFKMFLIGRVFLELVILLKPIYFV